MTSRGDAPAVLEVDHLRTYYTARRGTFSTAATVRAVDDVSFAIAQGETLGLVGESGCGKSTLSRTVMLLEHPEAGDVRLHGQSIFQTDRRQVRRDVQLIFQDPYDSLPPHMPVRTIVAEPLVIHRLAHGDELKRRVDRLIADVGLPASAADKVPDQLSGGQRQRVSIARALALEPSVIIADEAVSALDVSVQAQILNLLKDLQQRLGLTMLFVTHDIGVVSYLSHRVAVMYLGKIVEMGRTDQVINNPRHPYTRALMSAVPGLNRRDREELEILGAPPDPKNPPAGCAYHPRCPWAKDVCQSAVPELRQLRERHWAACHLLEAEHGSSAPPSTKETA